MSLPAQNRDEPSELETLITHPQHSCCAYGNVVVTRSMCAPDADYVREWVKALVKHAKARPQALGLVMLIDEGALPPNEAERVVIKNGYLSVQNIVSGAVQVVEGHGFAAAAKRSALMIINLTSGVGIPIKVVGSIADAAPLLIKLLATAGLDAERLTRAVEAVRARTLYR